MVTPEGKVVRSPGTDIPTFAEVYQQIHGKAPSGPAWEAYKLAGPTIRFRGHFRGHFRGQVYYYSFRGQVYYYSILHRR